MLSFDVRALAVTAALVDGSLAPDDAVWLPEDFLPDGQILVTGRVSVAGAGRYYFSGRIDGSATMDCRRCLVPATVEVGEPVSAIFSDDESEDADDPDVFPLADGGRTVDLRPVVREQWLLNVPSFAQCRPDCRGLCATCGADLNAGACTCATVPDSRWNALRAVRERAD